MTTTDKPTLGPRFKLFLSRNENPMKGPNLEIWAGDSVFTMEGAVRHAQASWPVGMFVHATDNAMFGGGIKTFACERDDIEKDEPGFGEATFREHMADQEEITAAYEESLLINGPGAGGGGRRYRATVHILLPGDIENHNEACDAMTGALSETLKYEGAILDWEYVDIATGPVLVDTGDDDEEWDEERRIGLLPVLAEADTETDDEAEIVTRSAPRWAWEIIDETLNLDSKSKAFDKTTRDDIRAALAAMVLACEVADDAPISRDDERLSEEDAE